MLEDLKIRQKARELSKNIYLLCRDTQKIDKDRGLKDQLQRSSVSVASNIAEGYGRGSKKDFIRFLYIARGSLAELLTQITISYDVGYIDEDTYTSHQKIITELRKMINGFINHLQQ